MAQKFGPDKRKGNKGRTTINPMIGGKAGDAEPKFQKEGAQPKTKITDTRISDSSDAGFSGSKKSIAAGSFKEAFAVAFAKKPGGTFTYKGKKYLATRKGQGKGPSKSRVEDKVSKSTIVKGKRDTTQSKKAALAGAGAGAGAKKERKLKNKVLEKKKASFRQRKAGGVMKAAVGSEAMKGKYELKPGAAARMADIVSSVDPYMTDIEEAFKQSHDKSAPNKKAIKALKQLFKGIGKGAKDVTKAIPVEKVKKKMGGGMAKKYDHGGFNTKGQGAAVRGTKFKGTF